MPYKIRHKGSGFKVTTPNHPQGFSKHPMSKAKAGAQLRAIKMHTNEEMAQAVVDTLLAEHCGNCPGDAKKVDQAELRKGTKDEEHEHDMPPKTARKTALQHLLRVDPKYYTKTEKALGESFHGETFYEGCGHTDRCRCNCQDKRAQPGKCFACRMGLRESQRCECTDPGCPACGGKCNRPATTNMNRADMADASGVYFCNDCAQDAGDAGVFGPHSVGRFIRYHGRTPRARTTPKADIMPGGSLGTVGGTTGDGGGISGMGGGL